MENFTEACVDSLKKYLTAEVPVPVKVILKLHKALDDLSVIRNYVLEGLEKSSYSDKFSIKDEVADRLIRYMSASDEYMEESVNHFLEEEQRKREEEKLNREKKVLNE